MRQLITLFRVTTRNENAFADDSDGNLAFDWKFFPPLGPNVDVKSPVQYGQDVYLSTYRENNHLLWMTGYRSPGDLHVYSVYMSETASSHEARRKMAWYRWKIWRSEDEPGEGPVNLGDQVYFALLHGNTDTDIDFNGNGFLTGGRRPSNDDVHTTLRCRESDQTESTKLFRWKVVAPINSETKNAERNSTTVRDVQRVADVNGDGEGDLLTFGKHGVHVNLSTGTGFEQKQRWIKDYDSATDWRATDWIVHPDENGEDAIITIFGKGVGGVYRSPDRKNLGGGGQTTRPYPDNKHPITAMVVANDGVYTVFAGRSVYFSSDGKYLSGGENPFSIYIGFDDPAGSRVIESLHVEHGTGNNGGDSIITAVTDGDLYVEYKSKDRRRLTSGPDTYSIYTKTR